MLRCLTIRCLYRLWRVSTHTRMVSVVVHYVCDLQFYQFAISRLQMHEALGSWVIACLGRIGMVSDIMRFISRPCKLVL